MNNSNKILLTVLICVVLIVIMLLGGCMLCGSNRTQQNSTNNTNTKNEVLTDSKAEQLAEQFAISHGGSWARHVPNASGIKMLSVSSTTIKERTDQYIVVVVKGSFYAEDDYGRNLGKYIYDWTVDVYPSEFVIGENMSCKKN